MIAVIPLVLAALLASALAVRERRRNKPLLDLLIKRTEERDAAIKGVRWVQMTPEEIARIAKTGCNGCHGSGTKSEGVACPCILKVLSNSPNLAIMPVGEHLCPAKLATGPELDRILANEKKPDLRVYDGGKKTRGRLS